MRKRLSYMDLDCPACGYHLAGLRRRRCPECGERFDPALIRQRTQRLKVVYSADAEHVDEVVGVLHDARLTPIVPLPVPTGGHPYASSPRTSICVPFTQALDARTAIRAWEGTRAVRVRTLSRAAVRELIVCFILAIVPGIGCGWLLVDRFGEETAIVAALGVIVIMLWLRRRLTGSAKAQTKDHADGDQTEDGVESLVFRTLSRADLARIADIDRSETIRVGYDVRDGALVRKDVLWDADNFRRDGDGEHSVAHQVAFCRDHMKRGAIAIGAFDDEQLVGIGVLTPDVRPAMAQLAYLHVSAAHRRLGIATELTHRLLDHARALGARSVYVSATPSESAVGFYLAFGFELTAEPLSELIELEPEDVHMVLEFASAP